MSNEGQSRAFSRAFLFHALMSDSFTADQFAIRLAEPIGDAEVGGLTDDDLIHALEIVMVAIRQNEAE